MLLYAVIGGLPEAAIGPRLPRGCAFLALHAFSVRLLLATQVLRARDALRHVPVILLGRPLPDEEEHIAHDPHTHSYPNAEEDALLGLIEHHLAA